MKARSPGAERCMRVCESQPARWRPSSPVRKALCSSSRVSALMGTSDITVQSTTFILDASIHDRGRTKLATEFNVSENGCTNCHGRYRALIPTPHPRPRKAIPYRSVTKRRRSMSWLSSRYSSPRQTSKIDNLLDIGLLLSVGLWHDAHVHR